MDYRPNTHIAEEEEGLDFEPTTLPLKDIHTPERAAVSTDPFPVNRDRISDRTN